MKSMRLKESAEPVVIDDQLIQRALEENDVRKPKDSEQSSAHVVHDKLLPSQVTTLKLSFRNIPQIDNIIGFDSLTKLQLDNNRIETIDKLSHLTNLEWLDLSFNQIKKIEGLEKLTKLTDLSLYKNQISVLENMDTLANLAVLSIGCNNISNMGNLQYLRRFKHLAVLNMAGNPVCSAPEYKLYVLVRVRNLKFLDYKLVDKAVLAQAREQYQEELRELIEKETAEEAQERVEEQRRLRLEQLKLANLQTADTLFDDMIREDKDFSRFRVLELVNQPFAEYEARFKDVVNVLLSEMQEKHTVKIAEHAEFRAAVMRIRNSSEAKCLKLIEEHESKRKRTLREVRASLPAARTSLLAGLKTDIEVLYDTLMDWEIELNEQFEEFMKQFDQKLSELTTQGAEIVRGHFGKLRELEQAFHSTVSTLATVEFAKVEKNELDYQLGDEAKQIYADKETLQTILTSFHDFQLGQIDGTEEGLHKYASMWMENTLESERKEEHQRNRNRVSEVSLLVDYVNAQLAAAAQ
eukprot:TRINITY_DN655_c0_g1_i3.p1 TRINITY_DN655_c0_g1~~TRINITY_DN655_c0_g1_i3.p1  ORF type:complete len:523 (-),score=266.82 TRINITY_DN655_c0_g1_i3:406-1974(-)